MTKISISKNQLWLAISLLLILILAFIYHHINISKEKPHYCKIAIVIDDLGYNLDNIPQISNIKIPLNMDGFSG